jgi:hypothetical protein
LPSTTYPKGQLLDGRNRLRICIELGIEPTIKHYTLRGGEEEYILAHNLSRRHLTDDQRVMITTEAKHWKISQAAHRRRQVAGRKTGRGRGKVAAKSTQAIRQPTTS